MAGIIRSPTSVSPLTELMHRLERRMGRVFEEPLLGLEWPGAALALDQFSPVCDVIEEPEQIRITAELPGVKPEDVKLSIDNNILTIAGKKEQVAEEKAEKVHRYERSYGEFSRSFSLPATVDASKIKASYTMGLLTIELPKLERAKGREIAIEVKKA